MDYDFHNAYLYPVDGVDTLRYVYRYPDMMDNFIKLTPYETYINFIPFDSNEKATLNDRVCPRICQTDGKVVPIYPYPMLMKCPLTKRISKVQIMDEDGNFMKEMEVPSTAKGNPTRLLTINMPCFKEDTTQEMVYVVLPSAASIDAYTKNSVVPPFLRPAPPNGCGCCPPKPPHHMADDCLFWSDDTFEDDDGLFVDGKDDGNGLLDFDKGDKTFTEIYEDYVTDTYVNVTLTRDDLATNKKQFLKVVTEDVS